MRTNMGTRWPNSRASCAAGVPPMRTIRDLRSHGRLAAKSVMNSLSHSVADIIARSIAAAMKPLGGRKSVSIGPSALVRCG